MLNITPGNDMLYVAGRSTGEGTRAGIVSALGITAGCLVHLFAAVIGLSAVIAKSALAFTLIKYAGAAYLLYLGIRSLVTRSSTFALNGTHERHTLKKIFFQGALTNVLNPKVALFFLAFLPQFVDVSQGSPALRILLLGSWFNFSGTMVNIVVAVLFGKFGNWLGRSPHYIKWQQKLTGILLIALGIKVAVTSGPHGR